MRHCRGKQLLAIEASRPNTKHFRQNIRNNVELVTSRPHVRNATSLIELTKGEQKSVKLLEDKKYKEILAKRPGEKEQIVQPIRDSEADSASSESASSEEIQKRAKPALPLIQTGFSNSFSTSVTSESTSPSSYTVSLGTTILTSAGTNSSKTHKSNISSSKSTSTLDSLKSSKASSTGSRLLLVNIGHNDECEAKGLTKITQKEIGTTKMTKAEITNPGAKSDFRQDQYKNKPTFHITEPSRLNTTWRHL
ncbi:unnamed protein product [Protopolystoma xenopodis]|uniref:Uncharacterized protein n=1 Tax=Protopolystoma xenopodis TaxID=117903 RepID=A0A3S5BPS2_9PLAT|nr:unnamed protein product [Protopolystoma xenopodis]